MVQWIEGNRVLMNNYINTDPGFRKRLLEALTPHFTVEELEFNTPRLNKLSWAYLNFLRIKNTIFVPGLHTKEDPLALQQIQQFYPDCKVIQVQGCEELARDGGEIIKKPTYLWEDLFGYNSIAVNGLTIRWVDDPEEVTPIKKQEKRLNLNDGKGKADEKPWRFIKSFK